MYLYFLDNEYNLKKSFYTLPSNLRLSQIIYHLLEKEINENLDKKIYDKIEKGLFQFFSDNHSYLIKEDKTLNDLLYSLNILDIKTETGARTQSGTSILYNTLIHSNEKYSDLLFLFNEIMGDNTVFLNNTEFKKVFSVLFEVISDERYQTDIEIINQLKEMLNSNYNVFIFGEPHNKYYSENLNGCDILEIDPELKYMKQFLEDGIGFEEITEAYSEYDIFEDKIEKMRLKQQIDYSKKYKDKGENFHFENNYNIYTFLAEKGYCKD
tara:strand:+ start:16251 stop:17054 length:804 start_codon:yes stop_codon:yes gene_type:complete